jgi:hypothetical protein
MRSGMTLRMKVVAVVVTLGLALATGVLLARADSGLGEQAATAQPTLVTVLTMLASGAGVGVVISFLFTKFTWFNTLSSSAKSWIVFGMAIGLPVAATAALQFIPAGVWTQLEPYWQAIATGFLIWAGSQAVYVVNKRLALDTDVHR